MNKIRIQVSSRNKKKKPNKIFGTEKYCNQNEKCTLYMVNLSKQQFRFEPAEESISTHEYRTIETVKFKKQIEKK